MRAIPIQLLLLLFVTFSVSAAEKKKAFSVTEQEEMMEHVSGAFDMSRNPRPYIVYMILDQQGSRYPSFWCGKNIEGKVGFKGQLDCLMKKSTSPRTARSLSKSPIRHGNTACSIPSPVAFGPKSLPR